MGGKGTSIGSSATLAIFTVTLLLTNTGTAAETVLHNFDYKHGAGPYASLIFDTGGNLYGTTAGGGSSGRSCNGNGCGTVFVLTPKVDGGWRETLLHNFNGKDGSDPVAGLILDAAGNLYGTTLEGGSGSCSDNAYNGCGTVFELTPKADGGWTWRLLHSFNNSGNDGYYPGASLVLDIYGNLYGTTEFGGTHNEGTVFELMPKPGGRWKEKVLHSFNNNGKDGNYPVAGLVIDGSGNLYGTTEYGGADGEGTVFELIPQTGGAWTEKILHSFSPLGKDGYNPLAGVIFDASNNLFGTTALGGSGSCNEEGNVGCGTVFEVTPKAGGNWTETVLYSFNSDGRDGNYPYAGLAIDATGSLYGTTLAGGSGACYGSFGCGTVFELTPKAGGGWTSKVLHSFKPNGKDGEFPGASLILDPAGSLYGTTPGGGDQNAGTVFELTPRAGGNWTEGP